VTQESQANKEEHLVRRGQVRQQQERRFIETFSQACTSLDLRTAAFESKKSSLQ